MSFPRPGLAAVLFVTLIASLTTCSGGDTSRPETRAAADPERPLFDNAASEPADLIYWDTFLTFESLGQPPARLRSLLDDIASRDDPSYRAILIELALYPTPYREQAWDLLKSGRDFAPDRILEIFGERALSPADDLEPYLEFKRRLMGTLDQDYRTLLDPSSGRTISAQEVIWGGVPIDGIPPLHDPAFETVEQASQWLVPSDTVIGVEINGDARAYPRRIIDWHEMVNDTVGGVPVSLAYCTLCGSAILYDGRAGDRVFRFGTSGLLYRSNKLMYDRETRTLWEQYTGEPVWGPLVGREIKLDVFPAVHTTWAEWLAAHPDTRVLSIQTGHRRDYGSGVAYADYWASRDLRFPAPNQEGPLAVKDVVLALRLGNELVAYPIALLGQRRFLQDEVSGRGVIVIATADGSGGRVYERGNLTFRAVDLKASTANSADGRTWTITEDALVASDGARLARLPAHNSFWFAVVNHAPIWRLYQQP